MQPGNPLCDAGAGLKPTSKPERPAFCPPSRTRPSLRIGIRKCNMPAPCRPTAPSRPQLTGHAASRTRGGELSHACCCLKTGQTASAVHRFCLACPAGGQHRQRCQPCHCSCGLWRNAQARASRVTYRIHFALQGLKVRQRMTVSRAAKHVFTRLFQHMTSWSLALQLLALQALVHLRCWRQRGARWACHRASKAARQSGALF